MSPHIHPSAAQLDAASWCRHLVPDGSVYAFLADHRQQLFPPALFADLVVQGRSQPSVPTQVVATVMVLHAFTNGGRSIRRSLPSYEFLCSSQGRPCGPAAMPRSPGNRASPDR